MARVSGREVAVGNSALLSHLGLPSEQEKNGVFAVIDGVLSGIFILGDSVKPQAKSALQKLKKMGAKRLFMLSGDKAEKVIPVACEVGIDEAKSELLPDDKYEELKKIISSSRKTAFVGDGINDSPSLALSDVGIAMGGIGSDSAIEAADVVIMNDDLSKISLAVRIARRTLLIAKENIVFALGVKALVLILGAFGYADMWLAVFADVGVAFIAILNSMRALRVRK